MYVFFCYQKNRFLFVNASFYCRLSENQSVTLSTWFWFCNTSPLMALIEIIFLFYGMILRYLTTEWLMY